MAKKTAKKSRKRTAAKAVVPGTALVPADVLPALIDVRHDLGEARQAQEDMLSVVLSRGEALMQKSLDDALDSYREIQQEVKLVEESADKILQEDADGIAASVKDDIIKALRPLGVTVAGVTASVAEPVRKENSKRWGKYGITLVFRERKGSSTRSELFRRTIERPTPKAAAARLTEALRLQASAQAVYQDAMGWKQKLANMARLERVTRSQIAEHRLRDTSDGAVALDAMLGSLEANIEKLPG